MNIPDLTNGLFELLGGAAIFTNVKRLLRDKQIRGVHWGVTLFFLSWGVWNLYYYPSLDQWASFAGGCVICIGNFCWLSLAIKYRRN